MRRFQVLAVYVFGVLLVLALAVGAVSSLRSAPGVADDEAASAVGP